ncbi:DUF1737 domain-containing protein [Escherichia coli]|nr:DUF1737 domain-containing protein [Escherichia coli]EJT7033941.1 DUF1737 domain-containing protein [Escherichia coli]EJZ1877686.1 DUF1737 domain-containing protein [Escherichia coli]
MAFKHYDVVRAASPSDLAERLTQKLKEGWQPFGSPVAITPYTLMQAIAAEGDVTTPVLVKPSGDGETAISKTGEPEYYYVVALAGQSNGMSFGEGVPLPDSYDRPDPRIKQLARRRTVTPRGVPCTYNDVIPADHCLHDVMDMSEKNHPRAELNKGQYGCVGQGLHIAKKLLPFIPANAGILLVPCCRGGSGVTTGNEGTFNASSGASPDSALWGADKPLYQDLLSRTKVALAKNPGNILLAVIWMQGESDLASGSQSHNALFTGMVQKFRADIADMSGQCVGGSALSVPWVCGDTTHYWKEKYAASYETVYGGYKNKAAQNIHFVPFMVDGSGVNVQTNNPAEDPDIEGIGYSGSKWRDSSVSWTSGDRASHFGSWARRGIISDRLATAILTHAGKYPAFITGRSETVVAGDERENVTSGNFPSPVEDAALSQDAPQRRTVVEYNSAVEKDSLGGNWAAQHWNARDGVAEFVNDESRQVLKIKQHEGKQGPWMLSAGVSAEDARALYENGGEIKLEFRLPDGTQVADDKYLFGVYLPVSGWTQEGNGSNMMASFFTQTKASNLDVMYHGKTQPNTKIESFGAVNNNWHTLVFKYKGGGNHQVIPVLDGEEKTGFALKEGPVTSAFTVDNITVTGISANQGKSYPVMFRSIMVSINQATSSS